MPIVLPAANPPDGSVEVTAALKGQLVELQPTLLNIAQITAVQAALEQLNARFNTLAVPAALRTLLDTAIAAIPDKHGDLSAFGTVLGQLYQLQQGLLAAPLAERDLDTLQSIVLGAIAQVRQLLSYRPDVGAILDDLTAVKRLSGGPADATSFHDFNVLQMAFPDVWMHAFNDDLKISAQELYQQAVRLYEDAGLDVPDIEDLADVDALKTFISELRNSTNTSSVTIPQDVLNAFGNEAATFPLLGPQQQAYILALAEMVLMPMVPDIQKNQARTTGVAILNSPAGPGGRLLTLISEIGQMLSEPYAFDVFARDSFNFGLMITYRQIWEPGDYQAGKLVSTIPLAPGETRKVSVKRVVKNSRVQKNSEKGSESRSEQGSSTTRVEADIMQKVSTMSNFKQTAHGTFNFNWGSIDTTSAFSMAQAQDSAQNKKAFHEATLKAAEEYKQERSLEVDTNTSREVEETSSGEISNPNNELTITYLYYELQRRYKVREFLNRVCPVILIAQDVPAPHEIHEAWLVQNQWILSRVLLDDSLRPALKYLASGLAGDELAVEVLKSQWDTQRALVQKLESLVDAQLGVRSTMREVLVDATMAENMVPEIPGALKILSFGVDPSDNVRGLMDAARRSGETRLKYVEEALADAQEKLKQATATFAQVTKEYVVALQNQYSRHVAIDQLRIHVKQNIFYYMQAIWDHEPPDQRFFRLYNKKIVCVEPEPGAQVTATVSKDAVASGRVRVNFENMAPPTIGQKPKAVPGSDSQQGKKPPFKEGGAEFMHDLVEIADLDNPIGYKGNYIIFPVRDQCYLTTYMLSSFVDNYLGAIDPDGSDDFDAEDFEQRWEATAPRSAERAALEATLKAYVSEVRRSTDEIIVPTGQLFVEALPGAHPLLEDFKLLHRVEDVRKVKAEVRHAELENIRLAARLVQSQNTPTLLDDPDIDKKIVVQGNAAVVADPNS